VSNRGLGFKKMDSNRLFNEDFSFEKSVAYPLSKLIFFTFKKSCMTNIELQKSLSEYPDDLEIHGFELKIISIKYDNPLRKEAHSAFFKKWLLSEGAALDENGETTQEYRLECAKMAELNQPLEKQVLNIEFSNLNS
jgi:hypothetical protein